MTKKKELTLEGAAILLEELFLSGVYPTYKITEHKLDTIRNAIQSVLPEGEKQVTLNNIVCKWVPYKVYEVDYKGLNEYLDALGILPLVARLDQKKIQEEVPNVWETLTKFFSFEPEYYIRITPNKNGKEMIKQEEHDFSSLSADELADEWYREKQKLKELENFIEKAKKAMLQCPILQEKGKLSCNYGSVSMLPKPIRFDIRSVYQEFGPEFLIEYSKPNSEELDFYIENGFISKSEIDQFRKVVDVGLRFVVMDIETEKKQREFLYEKVLRTAQNLRMKIG